ncbi:unnamed protein product [Macrosiphum euphorbiae]|uniref:Attractin/MKLN-like beta-propeller domain-containing protein n=1 Tax=Macrosiphum euphorbiae TaxID=13131 RepID=A0AAV0XUE3_9HEMI|nr:unnamed protein product [Macrosiphum euphorbiae]
MANNCISTYKFKPFHFTVLRKECDPAQGSIFIYGHQVVCNNNAYLLSFQTFNVRTNDAPGQRVMRQIWKYSLDSGEWIIVNCKNVPQELVTSYKIVTLPGDIIIIYGGIGVPSGGICRNRIYLANLANEYKENGMSFIDLEESGDVPFKLCGLGVVMDGKYIYTISNTTGPKNDMDVHRFDLSTRKWELLYKTIREDHDPTPIHEHKVVFFKGRIYIFGSKIRDADNNSIHYDFSKIHMFDVDTKQWQLLSAKHDHRVSEPGCPKTRYWHSCVQCPEKSNLVYLCGGLGDFQTFNDVWRIDIDTMQWEKLTNCIMPLPVYLHSTAVTPSGRICCYGGIVTERSDLDARTHSNDITSAWITIPKLKVICWEAMIHYFKEQMFKSSDECLKKIGIPQEFYERIIEARRIC